MPDDISATAGIGWWNDSNSWLRSYERLLANIIIGIAPLTWTYLIAASPQPYGFVYDDYQTGVRWIVQHWSMPRPWSCWVCAHPPLFFAAGSIPYGLTLWLTGSEEAALRSILIVTVASSLWLLLACRRLLTLYDLHGLALLVPLLMASTLPLLAFSAAAADADILLAALLCETLVRLMRCHLRRSIAIREAVTIGILAGLCLLTKYSGLLSLIWAGAVTFALLFRGQRPRDVVVCGLVILGVAGGIAGWRYAFSYLRYGTPFVAQGSAVEGFALEAKRSFVNRYEFTSFRVGEVTALYGQNAPSGTLTNQPVYRSVWTTLHAMTWTDMSFFSNPVRHGSGLALYPFRDVPRGVVATVLYVGLLPAILFAIGLAATLASGRHWPLGVVILSTMVVYMYWVFGQEHWALKTKYILFLLAPILVCIGEGIRVLHRGGRAAGAAGVVGLGLLVAGASKSFLISFALS